MDRRRGEGEFKVGDYVLECYHAKNQGPDMTRLVEIIALSGLEQEYPPRNDLYDTKIIRWKERPQNEGLVRKSVVMDLRCDTIVNYMKSPLYKTLTGEHDA